MNKKPMALITRPLNDAKITAGELADIGIDSFIEPVIEITPLPYALPEIQALIENGATALIITSRNAIRAVKDVLPDDFPIITVGEKTAGLATEFKLSNVVNAGYNAEEVVNFIRENYSAEDEKFIYAAANFTSTNLEWELARLGFDVREVVTYQANAVGNLSQSCLNMISKKEFDLMPVFSRRSSEIILSFLEKEDIGKLFYNVDIFCLSTNVAQPFMDKGYKKIHVAKKPESESLLELIRNFEFTSCKSGVGEN